MTNITQMSDETSKPAMTPQVAPAKHDEVKPVASPTTAPATPSK